MNFYKISGQVTRWMSFKLKEIGFANIKSFSRSNEKFLISCKDDSLYEITINKIK